MNEQPIATFSVDTAQTLRTMSIGVGMLALGAGAALYGGQRGLWVLVLGAPILTVLGGYVLYWAVRAWFQRRAPMLHLYKRGVVALMEPNPPQALEWGEFASHFRGWGLFNTVEIDIPAIDLRYRYRFVRHGRVLGQVLRTMTAWRLIQQRLATDPAAPAWVFGSAKPEHTVTVYGAGLQVGEEKVLYATITDLRIVERGRYLRVVRMGKPDVIMSSAVQDFWLLTLVLMHEVIDKHLVPKAIGRLRSQELPFSYAVVTPSGVRAPDNQFWSWPKLKEALIALNAPDPDPALAERLGWYFQQRVAEDVPLFSGLLLHYIGADYLKHVAVDTLLLHIRAGMIKR